jgi:hypothetical protein
MRGHTVRLYAAAATLLAFFVLWATIAARPWAPARARADPRILALAARERVLRREALQVRHLVAKRWHVYERRLRAREHVIALARHRHAEQLAAAHAAAARIAAQPTAYSAPPPGASATPAPATQVVTLPPPVRVVTLPAVTATSSSHP